MEFEAFGGLRLNPCAAAIAAAFAFHPAWSTAQQIVPDGQTVTSLSVQGKVTDVTTASIIGANTFDSLQRFDVWSGNTVNLHVPQAASEPDQPDPRRDPPASTASSTPSRAATSAATSSS